MADGRAFAFLVTRENASVILSEAGRKFNKDFLDRWFVQEGEGAYFVRDEGSRKLDCSLMPPREFHTLYTFVNGDENALYREVVRR
jgi:hypothetical protein